MAAKPFTLIAAVWLLAMMIPAGAQDAAPIDPDALGDAGEIQVGEAQARAEFRSLDEDVQSLKKEVLDLNRDLFLLEEELLFPANSQVAFFISMDVGEYFALDSVNLKIDGKEVANYLYTQREVDALVRGGVHRVHMENLKVGEHELAHTLRDKTLKLMMSQPSIFEYYNSETGEPPVMAAEIFGWSAAVFIDLAIQASLVEEAETPRKL